MVSGFFTKRTNAYIIIEWVCLSRERASRASYSFLLLILLLNIDFLKNTIIHLNIFSLHLTFSNVKSKISFIKILITCILISGGTFLWDYILKQSCCYSHTLKSWPNIYLKYCTSALFLTHCHTNVNQCLSGKQIAIMYRALTILVLFKLVIQLREIDLHLYFLGIKIYIEYCSLHFFSKTKTFEIPQVRNNKRMIQ